MKRYIDADNLFMTDFEIATCDGSYKKAFTLLLDIIANAPTADVVPVVRCKECGIRLKDGYCPNGRFTPHDDWFCADGKRRDNEEIH